MSATLPTDPATLERVRAALAAEPTLKQALAAEPVKVARERFGLDLPADTTLLFQGDRVLVGAGGAQISLALPPELQSDELPDQMLELAGGSGANQGNIWKQDW